MVVCAILMSEYSRQVIDLCFSKTKSRIFPVQFTSKYRDQVFECMQLLSWDMLIECLSYGQLFPLGGGSAAVAVSCSSIHDTI
jgi:hypothetical protein